ncbi:MAG: lipoyl(octanoyl) transferase LipB [Planctomycetota bacterium]|nr:lipoyl(octanoyl) transferase LipB [Planctomycetota bacterium]
MSTPRVLEVRRLGRTRYADAHALQQSLLAERVAGTIGDVLLLTEHDPVVTVGRGAGLEAAGSVQIPIVSVERGGEATYHGPGQVVGYPIVLLDEGRRDLHRWLRDLEEVVIATLADFGVAGRREDGFTGVWIGNKKVCSIGVAVRRWVTWHGFALNVHTDLRAFRAFQPCGLDPDVMTRLADHVARPLVADEVEEAIVRHSRRILGFQDLPA